MRKKRKIIGVYGPHLFNQLPMQFMKELRTEGLKHGYCITALSCTSGSGEQYDDIDENAQLAELVKYIPLSGMVILDETLNTSSTFKNILQICDAKNIPVFSINRQLQGCYNMTMQDVYGFELIIRHIVEVHGCKRINVLGGFKNNTVSDKRINVYKKVLKEHNIPIEPERIGYGDFWDRPARQAVRNFLTSSLPIPDAIICANDSMAISACAELQKFGYSVPEDIIVTGFDGILSGQYHFPVLTTCEPDYTDVAAFIINELEAFLSTQHFTPCEHSITFRPKFQQSCGCQPKTVHNLNHVISTLYENTGDSAWHNIAMNQLITDNLYNDNIMDLAKILPKHLHLWKDHFRFACVKSSMLSSCKIEDAFSEMTSILDVRCEHFTHPGESFPIEDFIPDIDAIENTDMLIVKLLNSGKTVYGYSVEGFSEPDERSLQRCNDFAFFLSYCLNTIAHNAKQKELADGLFKANEEISLMSLHDPMTGLFNRRGFQHEFQRLLNEKADEKRFLYIFSIDMNRLKYINDNFGHAEGDFAIITLSQALSQTFPKHCICARFGGDEFVIAVLHRDPEAYCISQINQKLQEHISLTNGVSCKPYPITASIGMSCQPFDTSLNIEALIATADKYMYEMKNNLKKAD